MPRHVWHDSIKILTYTFDNMRFDFIKGRFVAILDEKTHTMFDNNFRFMQSNVCSVLCSKIISMFNVYRVRDHS